jgi:hypothetical protein
MPRLSQSDSAEKIEQKLSLGLYLRQSKVEPGRQTWGGAGVIIRYPTSIGLGLDAKDERNDCDQSWAWNDEIFETPYAAAVAKLYKDIREFAAAGSQYNHLSRYELWGEVTKAGKSLAEERAEAIDGEALLRHMWAVAKELISKWEGKRNEDSQ